MTGQIKPGRALVARRIPAQWRRIFGWGRPACLGAVFFACALAQKSHAAPAPDAPPPTRYVLVFETSHAMQRRAAATVDTVQNLVNSVLKSQFRAGDTIEAWTTSPDGSEGKLAREMWSPQAQAAIAARLDSFVQALVYQRQARLENVLPALSQAFQGPGLVVAVLFTSGDEKIHGTPFDDRINEAWAQWRDQQQKGRLPVLTILRAWRGDITGYTVTPAPWTPELPAIPLDARAKQPRSGGPIAGALTNLAATSPPAGQRLAINQPANATHAQSAPRVQAIQKPASSPPPAPRPTGIVHSNSPAPAPQPPAAASAVVQLPPVIPPAAGISNNAEVLNAKTNMSLAAPPAISHEVAPAGSTPLSAEIKPPSPSKGQTITNATPAVRSQAAVPTAIPVPQLAAPPARQTTPISELQLTKTQSGAIPSHTSPATAAPGGLVAAHEAPAKPAAPEPQSEMAPSESASDLRTPPQSATGKPDSAPNSASFSSTQLSRPESKPLPPVSGIASPWQNFGWYLLVIGGAFGASICFLFWFRSFNRKAAIEAPDLPASSVSEESKTGLPASRQT